MGMGANSLNGKIDNEIVPRLLHENGKDGNKVIGIKDSTGRVFGEGQYPNQVVYNNFSGRFHYWDGSSKTWADFDGQNMNFAAAELFRSNYKSRTGTDSEGFNVAYKSAVDDWGDVTAERRRQNGIEAFETIKNRLNTIVIINEFTKTANNTPPKDA